MSDRSREVMVQGGEAGGASMHILGPAYLGPYMLLLAVQAFS